VRTRTNMNLDRELVAEAADVLGTRGATETVHAAMGEVVRAARRRRLAAQEFSDLSPEALDTLRRSRAAS
jgi:Arc/MetJ family transcription regulator